MHIQGERKERILQEGSRLIRERGFPSTRMRELAQKVGLEAASLYSHFRGKENILESLAWRSAEDFRRTVQPIYEGSLTTQAKLKAMMVAHVEVMARNQDDAAIFITEWKHLKEPARGSYQALRNAYEQMFRQVIYQGIVENLFRNVDEKLSTLLLLSALNGSSIWYRSDGMMSPTQMGETLAEMLLNGLIRTY